MQIHTIDELPADKAAKAEKLVNAFMAKASGKRNEQRLYDDLTNLGLSSEGADEYINMLVEA